MKNWFTKNLCDAMFAFEEQEQIKELTLSAYKSAENSSEMAAFFRHESEGRVHCEVKIYFTPMLAGVAREVNAEPCEKPSPCGLSLLVGSKDSLEIFFPDRINY